MLSAKVETPSEEMKRLIRAIGGKALAGEKDDQLRERAVRKLNAELVGDRQIGARRGRSYWHGEIEDVPSDHMDRARDLMFIQPIEEAIDAIAAAEDFLEALRSRLARRVGNAGSRGSDLDPERGAARPDGGAEFNLGREAGVPRLSALRRVTA